MKHLQLVINFTNREFEIINLLADGNRAKDIATELFVSEFTVRTHLKNILKKSQARNTTALVATCIRQGLI
ncbi:response regulator transcription factor [Roseivirga sp.]|uniref:response regulator transcription factor n=1 Tax=Roseivirga sp. TaxID=1964215 RepID=UPI003B8CAAB0